MRASPAAARPSDRSALSPELRIDPLTGHKVVVAPERASRPESFELSVAREGARDKCPLCEGREDWTPPETYANRPGGGPPDSPGWLTRAVPNKYPVITPADGGGAGPDSERRGEPDLFEAVPASGSHEVIVHTPEHVASLTDLSADQFRLAIEAWQARLGAHADAPYEHLIVNEGLIAGASLEHTHAQLYALDFVPPLVARERERFTAHNVRTQGGCLLCDLLQEEVRRRERVVAIDDHAVLLAPFASRLPYELQLVPRRHGRSITEAGPEVADLLRVGLLRLRESLGGVPPFNLWVRSAPRDAEHFHWHIDVVPRLTQFAGLELGAEIAVNIYPPERAAEDLRK
jgi:UDPglucose--hexose-1-phosphate uridylyltransferase